MPVAPSTHVIFDLDGTLANSHKAVSACANHTLRALGHATQPEAEIESLVGLLLRDIFVRLIPGGTAAQHDAAVAHYKSAYIDISTPITRVIPGIPALLDALAQAGCGLGVATGKSAAGAERSLRALALRHHFAPVLGCDSVPQSKPAPDMVHACLAHWGAPLRPVVVGDTEYDVHMALGAGVPAIGVAWGAHSPARLRAAGAQQVVHSTAELGHALMGRAPPC